MLLTIYSVASISLCNNISKTFLYGNMCQLPRDQRRQLFTVFTSLDSLPYTECVFVKISLFAYAYWTGVLLLDVYIVLIHMCRTLSDL